MKDASQYPVTFAYGATDGTYYGPHGSIGPYHRGDDRAMPEGTPVLVNGIQVGIAGHTGAASGPHLHIGRFVGGKDTDPHGQGFTFPSATVTQIGSDSVNGNFVRVSAAGASWVYLHLLAVSCHVGQVLTPPTPAPIPPSPADPTTVYLPAYSGTWHLYHEDSGMRPGTADVINVLRPDLFPGNNPPGLVYAILRVKRDAKGIYAVVVRTQMFGVGAVWVRNVPAILK